MKQFLTLIIVLVSSVGFSQSLPRKITDDNQIIKHNGYILSYNETCEQANWVYYTITPFDLNGEKVKRKNVFKRDDKVKTGSASLSDYKGSGYDRGHLKAASDEACDRAQMDETFLMSNMSPQTPSFNRGIWKKLENYVRRIVLTSDSVIVITGGVLTDDLKTIGTNKVCVPKFYYKVMYIYKDNQFMILCFLLPNKKSNESLRDYLIELDKLETFVQLKF